MNWQQDPIHSTADLSKDGSGYHVLAIQRSTRFIAWWAWPKEQHFTSNRIRECIDSLYDGASKEAAIAACEEHATRRAADAAAKRRAAQYFQDDYVPTEEFQHG